MNKAALHSIKSYVVGFALSLIFTLIPYYMVVHQNVQGTALLAIVLGFAILQLLIQVVFFLHIGRGPKPNWNLLFFANTIAIIMLVVGGSLWIMSHLNHNTMSAIDVTNKISEEEAVHQVEGAQTGTCPGGTGTNYKVVLTNDEAIPSHVDAHLCDTITIMNQGDAARDIHYGEHDKHELYAGEDGKEIRPGRNLQITLTETGTHRFHDHLLDEIQGDFTVTP